MNKTLVIILSIILYLQCLDIQGQVKDDIVAEESIQVKASSATILQWFRWIESTRNIILSYNPAQIDLDRTCRISEDKEMTVETLLKKVLHDYETKIVRIAPNKYAIQARQLKNCILSGTIYEEGSRERLYGAVVAITNNSNDDDNGTYSITNENGVFETSVKEGFYNLKISYMGYDEFKKDIYINNDSSLKSFLKPMAFEIDEVTVKSYMQGNGLTSTTPADMLSFNSNDLFSQIWILPGVTGIPYGDNFQVNGGGSDENLLLLDGVPFINPGHMNSLLPVFNGDAVKNIVFYNDYFPTRFEGRLSSVTDVKLKDGNKQEHVRTISMDMPAASIMLEGPIIKNKLSYMVNARRSWLDFFDELLSEEARLNHSTYDYNAKLTYDISHKSSLEAFMYGTKDNYNAPDMEGQRKSILKWSNYIYQLRFSTQFGKFTNSTSASYTSYNNKGNAEELGYDEDGYINSRIQTANVSTEFSYSPEKFFSARWGAKYTYEKYDIAFYETELAKRHEPIHQYSIYYDNNISWSKSLQTRVGVHFVGYNPQKHRSYNSIQPRFSIIYSPSKADAVYVNFSKMEQFYHYLKVGDMALPTDFRMPSIGKFKPRQSEHYETGWKHFLKNGSFEISAYLKTRRNVAALRPWDDQEELDNEYIMTGNGNSYGAKFYLYNKWKRWTFQLSYTFARSMERFNDINNGENVPSLYDIPHQANGAVTYKLTDRSSLSLGGQLHSGRIIDNYMDEQTGENLFRSKRENLKYRIDIGYAYKRSFGKKLLLVRAGFYNLIGNPSEEDILNFYSVSFNSRIRPYGSISFKF